MNVSWASNDNRSKHVWNKDVSFKCIMILNTGGGGGRWTRDRESMMRQ